MWQDVEAKNNEGNTALHWACLNGHKGAVLLLLSKQASPSALNKYVMARGAASRSFPYVAGAEYGANIGTQTCQPVPQPIAVLILVSGPVAYLHVDVVYNACPAATCLLLRSAGRTPVDEALTRDAKVQPACSAGYDTLSSSCSSGCSSFATVNPQITGMP